MKGDGLDMPWVEGREAGIVASSIAAALIDAKRWPRGGRRRPESNRHF